MPIGSYYEDLEQQKARAREELKSFIPRLEELGVTFVVMFYNGSGDEGREEPSIYCTGASKEHPDLEDTYDLSTLPDDLDDLSIDRLGPEHQERCKRIDHDLSLEIPDGYENNSGSFGAVILNVKNRSLRSNHADYIENVEFSNSTVSL